ncbi:MAG TPA: phosphoribosyltransferase family protein [Bacteroidia bacterium]|jgi:pyrimidine operon attenuation protein/uracil phosphoribosyltransferase|nr:phosphoribosyltransferase family protein [Bacteroidia bacterium]
MKRTEILTAEQIQQKLNRLAYEIYEHTLEEKEVMLAGIEGNGYTVAKKLSVLLKKIAGQEITVGKITLDKKNPLAAPPKTDFEEADYKNKVVIVVDDVLNSGKTLIYAVQLFLSQPVKKLHTVVLVDRSHTRYPVKADFVGLSLSTTLQEHIVADLSHSGKETVYLE